MQTILYEITNLRLELLYEDWVQSAYHSEFLEFTELPSEYEDSLEPSDLSIIFKKLIKCFNSWLTTDSDEEKSWASLTNHVKHQNLLALLAYYIDLGGKNILNLEHRNNALLASRVYYKLLSVPGYKAYNIYHSQLFAHSLSCLGFPKIMCENDENYYNTKELTREVNSVIKELKYFANDLKTVVESLQLRPTDMNFEDILSNLVDVTGGAIVNKLNVDKIELANISQIIYEMIDIIVCDSNKEPNATAIKLLFKCLLPKFVAASLDVRNANNLVRASYVTYSGLLLTKYGKAALSGYIILLQHLCYTADGLERSEVRSARVTLVIGLMSLLPRKSFKNIVKWILMLSVTAKLSHRQIALDMLSNLLYNDLAEKALRNDSGDNENPESSTKETRETSKENNQSHNVIDDNIKILNDKVAASTDDENSQDLLPRDDETEEDVTGLLRQRSHAVPYADILRAVYERVSDVSSTLRTRAVTILTDVLTSDREHMKNAIKELDGDGEVGRLMALAARCVCDERAVVRRVAVGLVHRLLTARGAPAPQSKDLAILINLCRDASILVRSSAIASLGDLVLQQPVEAVLDAFLTGPMHQLSDPETKVQEQVVNLVQQLIIDRFRKYTVNSAEDLIPWHFLAAVIKHNMRRHLQKACTILVKVSNCISHRLVDALSTHLGTVDDDRNLQCLVMLTSVARYVDYADVGFVLDYYYKLAEDSEVIREVRLMPLTLELLSVWSRWVSGTERITLRDHLVRHLAHADDDGCRISRASLAAQLAPDNLLWATELMQLSERSGTGGVSAVSEWVRAADLSLVAPQPPQPTLLTQFLAALADPPPDWGCVERAVAVAGVGRLCVRSREAAAAAAPPLAALLRDGQAPLAARTNALLALTDICIRYTCIVEPLLGAICGCLARGERVAPLRRAAARALTRLLLAGYLRLRTPLYYRYCALLADEDHDVREPAEYYVTCCLTTDAIYHHFVDCVLYYNRDEDSEKICFDARQLIYDVMLQRMSLVQKLNVQCRLAREIMQHAADIIEDGPSPGQGDSKDGGQGDGKDGGQGDGKGGGEGDEDQSSGRGGSHGDGELPPALHAALLDTITLLCGPRMKLPKKPQNNGDAADIDDLQERVTTNIVSHKMKRTVAEMVVPAVLRLYGRLRARGGQLATYLVRIATDLLTDYRHEIEELIQNDEELVERVRHFQETIGFQLPFGNARNLVTSSAPPEPETPRAPRKRPARANTSTPRKRALRI